MKASDIQADDETVYLLDRFGDRKAQVTVVEATAHPMTGKSGWTVRYCPGQDAYEAGTTNWVTSRDIAEPAADHIARMAAVKAEADAIEAQRKAKFEANADADARISATLTALGVDKRSLRYRTAFEDLVVSPVDLDLILRDVINATALAAYKGGLEEARVAAAEEAVRR